ncbi:hypothetical protein [Halalkalibacter alkalisediminis]|uniref:Uncharacterized protein n=1 Tax=Halalkalibacter alkalisediminis TaxID=935616 RepID=A0ABV6NBY8_9BACI|nr:hypothetical protein [Halalkalibacter alkalisediminis]
MKHQRKQSEGKLRYLIVSKDGMGDFSSIQKAIDTVPEQSEPITIFIKPGV